MKRFLLALVLVAGSMSIVAEAQAGGNHMRGNGSPFRGWLYRGEYAHYFPHVAHRYPYSYFYDHGNPGFNHSYWAPFYRGPGRTLNRGYTGAWKFSF